MARWRLEAFRGLTRLTFVAASDSREIAANAKPIIFTPSHRKCLYNEICAKYVAQSPAQSEADISATES